MGRHLLVVLMAMLFVSACAALDSSENGTINPSSSLMASGQQAGVYAGTYKGKATKESNTCKVAAKDEGDSADVEMVVRHLNTEVNISVNGAPALDGTLSGEKVIVMSQDGVKKVHNAYYLTFGDKKIDGTNEIIEINDDGMYGNPCAVYNLSLTKEGAASASAKK